MVFYPSICTILFLLNVYALKGSLHFIWRTGETEVAPIILNGSDKELPGEGFFE